MVEEAKTAELVNDEVGQASLEAEALTQLKSKNDSLEKELKELREAKKNYYDRVLNSTPDQAEEVEEEPVVDLKGLIESTFNHPDTIKNRELVQNILTINDERRKRGLPSGFLPTLKGSSPTADEMLKYDYDGQVETLLRQCIEESDDDETFEAVFKKHCKDYGKTAKK